MKKFILSYITLLLFFTGGLFAQSPPHRFSYQAVIRNPSGTVLANKTLTLQVEIIDPGNPDTAVFIENHTATTNEGGLLNLSIGSINDLASVDWGKSKYMVRISIDGEAIALGSLDCVPHAVYTRVSDSVTNAGYPMVTGSPDFSGWDKNLADDFNGNYTDLINTPVTISSGQRQKLDSLNVSGTVNLDDLANRIAENTEKASFPGFGNEAGKAYAIIWTQAGKNVFYNEGHTAIGITDSVFTRDIPLQLKGGIKYEGDPGARTPGLLYYNPAGTGFFYYYDDDSTMKVLGASSVSLTWTNVMGAYDNDLILHRRLAVGHGTYIDYPFGDNVFVMAGDTLAMYFNDTSTSSAFPTTDWMILINDPQSGGNNYFAIRDSLHENIPFIIMAGSPDKSIVIGDNGHVGIDTLPGSNRLITNGSVKALKFVGSASQLTNISFSGTNSVTNTGSTTVVSDADADNTGSILFKTSDTTRMELSSRGTVGIDGEGLTGSNKLALNGTMAMSELNINGNLEAKLLNYSVSYDTIPGTAYFPYTIPGGRTLFATPQGTVSIYSLSTGAEGQQLTIINNSNSGKIILYPFGNIRMTTTITLDQYETASLVYTNGMWIVVSGYTVP